MLCIAPVGASIDPGPAIRQLVAAAEHQHADPAKQARNEQLAQRLAALDPHLERHSVDVAAVAAADPELTPGQVAQLGREINLGWPGVQISLGDDWASFEIATWPELAEPAQVERVTRLVELICVDTGWSCVGEYDEVFASPGVAVKSATATAGAWGDAVRRHARQHDVRRRIRRWLRPS